MFSADASVFVPKGLDQQNMTKGNYQMNVFDDACSTAAPSPDFTHSSPWASPWASPSLPVSHGGRPRVLSDPEFALPEVFEEESDAAPEFKLEGLDAFQSSLSGLFAGLPSLPANTAVAAYSPSLMPMLPPGLAPPPGLEQELTSVKKSLTVAELHAQFAASASMPWQTTANASMPWQTTANAKVFQSVKQGIVGSNPLPPGSVTAMLRNIPNKYTRSMMVKQLNKAGFKGDYDFLYLPIDFKNRCNVGYVFLSFRTPEACARFGGEYHGTPAVKKLPGFNTTKICEVSPARVQGSDANVRRLQGSPLMSQLADKPDWLPCLFDKDGEMLDFPVPEESSRVPVPHAYSASDGNGQSWRRGGRDRSQAQ